MWRTHFRASMRLPDKPQILPFSKIAPNATICAWPRIRLSRCTYMQLFKLKVISIVSGSNANGSSRSEVLRDGWGTPRNQPQLVAMEGGRRFDKDDSPEAA